jgi:integrase
MGSIVSRKRKDGTVGHTAQIRIKHVGKVVFTESQTFDRKPAAQAWLKKRETELAQPGALTQPKDPQLKDVIDQYNQENQKAHGKTKTQVLDTIRAADIGSLRCSEITSQALVKFAQSIDAQPSTRGNYISHLASIFSVAKPAWGYPLDKQAMDDARVVLDKMGLIGRSKQRTRRPTLDELDRLMDHFSVTERKGSTRKKMIPMTRLVAFAIFSTRRQEEICRMLAKDLDATNMEITVRDMKNPGEKIGNDVRTTLTPEALQLITQQSAKDGVIWPYNSQSVSTAFTRACVLLGIDDLHFHDLRHEGISRLFELGWTIPRVACVSGHRSWTSLKRYTHLRQEGDKYKDWPWLAKLGIDQTQKSPPGSTSE